MPALVRLTKKLPASVRWICGDPPLLSSEKRKDYETLFSGMADHVKPNDPIEWMWLSDVVDHTWEIRRLRRFKHLLIEFGPLHQDPTHQHNAAPQPEYSMREVARRMALILQRGSLGLPLVPNKNEQASETPEELTKPKKPRKPNRPKRSEEDSVQAFRISINEYLALDRLLSSAEDRRNAVLREIQRRREGLGQRLRQASDDVIDAEYSETAMAAE